MSARVLLVVRCPNCRTRARISEEGAQLLADGIDFPITCAQCHIEFLTAPNGETRSADSQGTAELPLRADPPFRDLIDPEREATELPPFGPLESPDDRPSTANASAIQRWWQGTSQRKRKQLVALGLIVVACGALVFPVPTEVNTKPIDRPPEPRDAVTAPPAQEKSEEAPIPPRLSTVYVARERILKNQQVTAATSDALFLKLPVENPPEYALFSEESILDLYALQDIAPGQILSSDLFGKQIVPEPIQVPIRAARYLNGDEWTVVWWVQVSPGREVRAIDEEDARRMAREIARKLERERDNPDSAKTDSRR